MLYKMKIDLKVVLSPWEPHTPTPSKEKGESCTSTSPKEKGTLDRASTHSHLHHNLSPCPRRAILLSCRKVASLSDHWGFGVRQLVMDS